MENYTLEYSFQYMPGSLPGKSQTINSSTGLKYRTKEADQHKKELKEKPNMSKKADTGSTKLPLSTARQPY
jgi:hypothetical protein